MYFALDFGGTNYRISWTKSLTDINVFASTLKIKNTRNYKVDTDRIISIMESRSTRAGGIVIALPGHFNHENMVLSNANNFKTWENKQFFRQLGTKFECDLIVYKDSHLAAIGESVNDTLNGKFLYINWGTGIGGCVTDTSPGRLPELGVLDWKKTFKQIEALCGGGNASDNFGVEMKYLNPKQWNELISNFVNQVEKICNKLKLRYVVLGGGITDKKGEIVSIIQTELKKRNIILVKSRLGDLSAIYGGYAVLLSKKKIKFCKSIT